MIRSALILVCLVSLAACAAPPPAGSGGAGPSGTTGTARSLLTVEIGTAGTLFGASDAPVTGSVLLAAASDCGDAGAGCTTNAYVPPGHGAGGAESAYAETVDAPLCTTIYGNGTASPVPCFSILASNIPPTTLVVKGSAVVSYYPDGADADSTLALVQNPCSGQGADCSSGGCDADAGATCDEASGCCETPGVAAVLDLFPTGSGTVGAKVVGVPQCSELSPSFPCWRPR